MGDPYWYYKVLGLHCDGTNGSTAFTAVGPSPKTVTANGNAQISTAQYPALTGKTSSGYLDGTGDYLSVTDSADWDFGTGDFTVRFRLRFSAHTGNASLVSNYLNSTTGWAIQYVVSGSTLRFYYAGDSNYTFAWTPSDNTWYDVEISRSGTSLRAFIDGSQIGTTQTDSTNISGSTTTLKIGSLDGAFNFLNGYISEVEIYKGLALHTANFTPTTVPFADEYVSVSGTTKDASGNFASRLVRIYHRDSGSYVGEVISNPTTGAWKILATKAGKYQAVSVPTTKSVTDNKRLAIPFSGENNSTNFTDLVGAVVRPVGGSKIVTTQTDPFGGSSGVLNLSSASDSVSIARALDGIGATGDFHIRCWVRPATFPDGSSIFFTGTNGFQWQRNAANNLGIAKVGVTWYFYASSNPTIDTWTYIQLRRSGTTLAIYYGSTLVGSATNSVTFDSFTSGSMFGAWTGYVCDFEFLQYADSVTPPTSRLVGFGATTENAVIYDDITPV